MKQSPFPKSDIFSSIRFTGQHKNYTNADTWYPSWADDDNLYSPWTDGYITDDTEYHDFDDNVTGYPCNSLDFDGRKAATAQAKIIGNDPLNLEIVNLIPRIEADPSPYGGRYPAGSLVHDGVWYYGTYCLDSDGHPTLPDWVTLGPLVGFRYSTDYGQTWTETPHTPANPLFGENPYKAKVKIGEPHFVDFGKNMEHSPDGKAYLVGHGATHPDSINSWIRGDQIYLTRVKPSIETINDASAYEFFAGHDDNGQAIWSSTFDDIQPILEWEAHLGCVTITYNPTLKKYIMAISCGHAPRHYDTMFLESDSLTEGWSLIQYFESFGPTAYFVTIPTKFISEDGLRFWVIYSANWDDKNAEGDPKGSAYSMSLHEVELIPTALQKLPRTQRERYTRLRNLGVSPKEMAYIFERDNIKGIQAWAVLMNLYELTLVEAKEVMMTYDGQFESLDEFQWHMFQQLEPTLILMTLEDLFHFNVDDMGINRAGQLTDYQQRRIRRLFTVSDLPDVIRLAGKPELLEHSRMHIDGMTFALSNEQYDSFSFETTYEVFYVTIHGLNVIVSASPIID